MHVAQFNFSDWLIPIFSASHSERQDRRVAARHRDLLFLAGVVHLYCALNVGIPSPHDRLI